MSAQWAIFKDTIIQKTYEPEPSPFQKKIC